jgi:tRNA-dihydrouridine synthase
MLSTRRLPSERLDTAETLRIAENEAYFIPQLLGNEERFIAPSIEKLLTLNPWGFDINMGCPVTHTLRHNWGVKLMGDKVYAAEVVRLAKKYSPKPVSVKLRAGYETDDDLTSLLSFTQALEEAGADWITLHARHKSQGHKGIADWEVVKKISAVRKIPVVANGDIQTSEDAIKLMREGYCDGVMVARSATARPWILAQIAKVYYPKEEILVPQTLEEEGAEYFRACLKYIDLLEKYFGNTPSSLKRLRFFISLGSQWFFFGHNFWKHTMKGKDLSELREIITNYAEKNPQPMRKRIDFK